MSEDGSVSRETFMDEIVGEIIEFRVGDESAEQRLDQFLAARLRRLSRMGIAALIRRGACLVNAKVGRAGQRLCAGDVVKVSFDEDAPNSTTPEALPLDIVYEDAHLLVVNKASGMLVHPTRGVKTGTLANALVFHLNRVPAVDFELPIEGEASSDSQSEIHLNTFVRPGIVHRLDRATSGLMVVAKTQRALSILSRHFHERLVEKRYLALVRGALSKDELHINAPIGRDEEAHPKWRVLETGKPAATRLRVLERCARRRMTLVELEPITGRTNQLRIHCAHAGHPIVGDEWYGGGVEDGSDALAAERLCLHAARLAFHHPSGGEWMEFASPLPVEMKRVFDEERASALCEVDES